MDLKESIILDKVKEAIDIVKGKKEDGIEVNYYKFSNYVNEESSKNCDGLKIIMLEENIYDETIVIEEGNIIIDGNGFSIINKNGAPAIVIGENIKNVTIKNIKIEYAIVGVFSEGQNVKIEESAFKNINIGVMVNATRNISVVKSIFINNTIGIAFFNFVSSSNIIKNSFLNNIISIAFIYGCAYNQIGENEIINNILKPFESGILLGENNSFNEISKNTINFSKDKYEGTFLLSEIVSIGISISGKNNIMNKISENIITYECTSILMDGYLKANIKINNIYIDKSSSNEISNNKLSIKENEFVVSGENINVDINNIYLMEEIRDCKIYNNKIDVCKNTIKPFGFTGDIIFENIVLNLNNSNTLIKNNTVNLYLNLSCVKDGNENGLKEYRNGIKLFEKNSSNTIVSNIIYAEKNGASTGNGVLLYLNNTSNEITENYFKKISHFAIKFESENNSNFISRNKIIETKGSAILFSGRALRGNDFNIITCNDISKSRANGILFLDNNKENSISNNHINYNCFNGILFENKGNIFNYIFRNSFKGNGEDISIGENEKNYIEDNLFK